MKLHSTSASGGRPNRAAQPPPMTPPPSSPPPSSPPPTSQTYVRGSLVPPFQFIPRSLYGNNAPPVNGQFVAMQDSDLETTQVTTSIAQKESDVGALITSDIGATTPFMWALREREAINDFIEELCGARLTYNYHRIGGVSFDVPKGWQDKVKRWVDHFVPLMSEFDRLITVNDIYSFDPNVTVEFDEFADIVGRHFRQPAEGLGFDGSPVAHMWRTMIWPNNFL